MWEATFTPCQNCANTDWISWANSSFCSTHNIRSHLSACKHFKLSSDAGISPIKLARQLQGSKMFWKHSLYSLSPSTSLRWVCLITTRDVWLYGLSLSSLSWLPQSCLLLVIRQNICSWQMEINNAKYSLLESQNVKKCLGLACCCCHFIFGIAK